MRRQVYYVRVMQTHGTGAAVVARLMALVRTRDKGVALPVIGSKGDGPTQYAAALLLAVLAGLSASVAKADSDAPSREVIVSMAQHFVQEHVMFATSGHYHIEFDVAYLHPQPDPDYWAVVGGYVSDQNIPNTYVAAIRQICPEFTEVTCWRLEKLAINRDIVVDRGQPL